MPYTLKKTDGSILVVVPDLALDTRSCSLTLIGKNAVNFGLAVDENFIGLLQNWSNNAAPSAPLAGQIWYNNSTGSLSYYNNAVWKEFNSENITNTGNFTKEISLFKIPVIISMASGNVVSVTSSWAFDSYSLDSNLTVGTTTINLQSLFPNGLVQGINMPFTTGLRQHGVAMYANVFVNSPNISIGGALSGQATFTGLEDIEISAELSNVYVSNSNVTINGVYNNVYVNDSGQIVGYSNVSATDITSALGYVPYDSAVITSELTSNTVVARDVQGNFTANSIVATTLFTVQMAFDTAIKLNGATNGSEIFDGVANVVIQNTLNSQSNLEAGVYNSVTVNKQGFVTSAKYYNNMPLYSIIWYNNVAIPTGWAVCNGQTVLTPNGEVVTTPNLSGSTIGGLEYIMKCYNDVDLPDNQPAVATIEVDLKGGGTPYIVFAGGPEPDYPPLVFSQDINTSPTITTFYTIESANVKTGGTSFKVGDILTVPGAPGSEPAKISVTKVNNGAILAIKILSGGNYPSSQNFAGLVPQWYSNTAIQNNQVQSTKKYRNTADKNKVDVKTGNVRSTGNASINVTVTTPIDLKKITLPINVTISPNQDAALQSTLARYANIVNTTLSTAPVDQNAVRVNSTGTPDQYHLPISTQTTQTASIVSGKQSNSPKLPTTKYDLDKDADDKKPTIYVPKSNLFAYTSGVSTNTNSKGGSGAVFDYNVRLVEANIGYVIPAVDFGQSVYFDAVALALSQGDVNSVALSQSDLFGDLSNLTILQVLANLLARQATAITPRLGKYLLSVQDILQTAGKLAVPVDITRFTISCQDKMMVLKTTADANKFSNLGMYPTDNHLFGAAYVGFDKYMAIYNARRSLSVAQALVGAGFNRTNIPSIDNITCSQFLLYCYQTISNAKVTVSNNKALIKFTTTAVETFGSKANVKIPEPVLHQPFNVLGNSNVTVTETTIDGLQFYFGGSTAGLVPGFGGGALVGNSQASNTEFYTLVNQLRYFPGADTVVVDIFGGGKLNLAGEPAFNTGTGTNIGVTVNIANPNGTINGALAITSNSFPKSGGYSSGSSSTSIGTSVGSSSTSNQPSASSVSGSNQNTVNPTSSTNPTSPGTGGGGTSAFALDGTALSGIIQGESAGKIVFNYNGAAAYQQYYGTALPDPVGLTIGQILDYQSKIINAVSALNYPNASSAVGSIQAIKATLSASATAAGISLNTVYTPEVDAKIAEQVYIQHAKEFASSYGIPATSVTVSQASMAISYGPAGAAAILKYIAANPNGTWNDLVNAGVISKSAANNNPAIASTTKNTPLSQVIPNADKLHNVNGVNGTVSPSTKAITANTASGGSTAGIAPSTKPDLTIAAAPPGTVLDIAAAIKAFQKNATEQTLAEVEKAIVAANPGISYADLIKQADALAKKAGLSDMSSVNAYDSYLQPKPTGEGNKVVSVESLNWKLYTVGQMVTVGGYQYIVQSDGTLRKVNETSTYAGLTQDQLQNSVKNQTSTQSQSSGSSSSGGGCSSPTGCTYTSGSSLSSTGCTKPTTSTVSTGCTKPATSTVSTGCTKPTTSTVSSGSSSTSSSSVSSGSTLSYYMYGI